MNKEIEEIMLTVPQKIVAYDGNPAGQHLYGEQRQEIAEALYNAGYRKTFTSDLASDTQKAFKEGYEKAKEEQTMIYLKFPPIEKIQGYKTYGNKHLKFWRNTVTKDDYIVVVLCGERVSFPATQDGVDKAEKWVNEKRAEIANALKL